MLSTLSGLENIPFLNLIAIKFYPPKRLYSNQCREAVEFKLKNKLFFQNLTAVNLLLKRLFYTKDIKNNTNKFGGKNHATLYIK
ncbi:hypothetical protein SAMN04488506_2081 [Desemzia incerta]|uniref:Uncharacterized protein n=1 Tax=Desemzia incerta TaxID=82801 RepID=A0A1I5YLL2_9LACT|nr:hypothetical protein SAMN04488506_2081 [Desemzia incerta]